MDWNTRQVELCTKLLRIYINGPCSRIQSVHCLIPDLRFVNARLSFYYFKILTNFTYKRIRANIGLKWFYFKHEIYEDENIIS